VVEVSGESHCGKTRLAVSIAALTLLFTDRAVAFIGTSLDNYIGMLKATLTKFYHHFIMRICPGGELTDAGLPPGKLEEYFSRLNLMSLTDVGALPSVLEEGGALWRLFQAKPDISLVVIDSIGSLRVLSGIKTGPSGGESAALQSDPGEAGRPDSPDPPDPSESAAEAPGAPGAVGPPEPQQKIGAWKQTKHTLVLTAGKGVCSFARLTQCAVLMTNQVTAYIEGPDMVRTARWLADTGRFPGQDVAGTLPVLRMGISRFAEEIMEERASKGSSRASGVVGNAALGNTGNESVWELRGQGPDSSALEQCQNDVSDCPPAQRMFFEYLSPEEGESGDGGEFQAPGGGQAAPLTILSSLALKAAEDRQREEELLLEALRPSPQMPPRGSGPRDRIAQRALQSAALVDRTDLAPADAPHVQLIPLRAKRGALSISSLARLRQGPAARPGTRPGPALSAPRPVSLQELPRIVALLLRTEGHRISAGGKTVYRDAVLADASGQVLTPALGLAFPQYLDTRVMLTQRHGHVLWSRDAPTGSFIKA